MRFAGTTLIQPTAENGLQQASVALVFQLRAIDRRRIEERIGSVSVEVVARLSGFAGAAPLTAAFRRSYGLSPARYRSAARAARDAQVVSVGLGGG